MKKQTAVEWLETELKKIPFVKVNEVFKQAKAMEKQQIMDAWYNGFEENRPYIDHSEEYYNETFNSEKP